MLKWNARQLSKVIIHTECSKLQNKLESTYAISQKRREIGKV